MFDSVLTEQTTVEPLWKQRLRAAIKVVEAIHPSDYDQSAFSPFNCSHGCAAHHIARELGLRFKWPMPTVTEVCYWIGGDNSKVVDDLHDLFMRVWLPGSEGFVAGAVPRDLVVARLREILNA